MVQKKKKTKSKSVLPNTFEIFVHKLYEIFKKKSVIKLQSLSTIDNLLLKPQNEWISENGKLDSEVLLGKFEELDDFIKEICEKKNSLGSYQNFKNYNMNKSIGRKNYKDEYTEETKRMVNEMYKKDIEIFNYDF